jgi:hypothetical protein
MERQMRINKSKYNWNSFSVGEDKFFANAKLQTILNASYQWRKCHQSEIKFSSTTETVDGVSGVRVRRVK